MSSDKMETDQADVSRIQSGPQTNRLELPSTDGAGGTPNKSINLVPNIQDVQITATTASPNHGNVVLQD